jgi:hypothetical protein
MSKRLIPSHLPQAALTKSVTTLVMVGLVAGCALWRTDDPRLVRGTPPEVSIPTDPVKAQQQAKARRKAGEATLQGKIGERFPDLTLIDSRGRVVRLSDFRGHRLAVLAAIGPVEPTRKWMEELASQGWEVSPGFDDLVVLVSQFGDSSWMKQIKGCPKVYLVGFPLEGYLAVWQVYPTMYAVGADGTFESFWFYGQEPVA